MINFRLDDDGLLQVDHWGTLSRQEVYEVAYPGLEAALSAGLAEEWEPGARPVPEPIRAAIEHERERRLESVGDEKRAPRTE